MSCDQFKQGDWVAYHDKTYCVSKVVGYNVYIYPTDITTYHSFGWHDPRAVFGDKQIEQIYAGEIMVLDRDCTLIPKEVADIMKGV